MAFAGAVNSLLGRGGPGAPSVGSPPPVAPIPPPPQTHDHGAPLPAYDIAHDPTWMQAFPQFVHDQNMRNLLNNLGPEERQLLFQTLTKMMRPGAVPPGVPPDIQQRMMNPASPASTSRAPGVV